MKLAFFAVASVEGGVVGELEFNAARRSKSVSASLGCEGLPVWEVPETYEGTTGLDVTLIELTEKLARSRKFFRLSGLSNG